MDRHYAEMMRLIATGLDRDKASQIAFEIVTGRPSPFSKVTR